MASSPQPSSTPAVANTPPAPNLNPPAMIQAPSTFSYNVSQFRADTPTLAQQPSAPSSISNSTMALSSSPNIGISTSHAAMTPFFAAHSGLPGTPQMNLPAVNTVPSSAQRPIIQTAALAPNPVQQQNFRAYPSVPGMAAPPHGHWFQPPPMGGVPRGPFLPYSAAFPGPFTSLVPGYSHPSVAPPDYQLPGATPAGIAGANSPLSSASVHPLTVSPGMQKDLPPPGIENKSHSHILASKDNTSINDSSDSWTAHKTDTGVVYYYNSVTGVSTYEKPPGFNGEPEKVSTQRTPVSMENVVGTDWALITTNDGKKYYYNNKTKLSSWQIPLEVAELKKKQEAEVKEQEMPASISSVLNEKGSLPVSLSAPAISTGGRDSIALRPSATPGAASALDLIKRKLQDSGSPVSSSPAPVSSGITAIESNGSRTTEDTAKSLPSESSKERLKDANGDANASESSSDSEDDSGSTKEECAIQFKEMLKERGIPPFAKWKEELPKIVFDPRFKAIPSHSTRRSLFEHYVKTRAEEERKEKRAAQRLAIDGFRQLLEEASEEINHNTDYQSFRKKWGNDPRFVAVDRKDREHLLNERVLPLKKAAQEQVQAERAAVASSFKSMLREKGDITVNSRWSKVKESFRDDTRYKSVKHEDREVLFNEYLSELKAADEDAERGAKIKREEQEKLKERERELRKRKEREEQEMERVREKVRKKEAVESFQALLVETIKDPQASWTESKTKLEKDPQGRGTNSYLDSSDAEKLFREHVKMLHERCAHGFKALLSEVITAETASQKTEDGKTVLNSWSTAKRMLKQDPRYNKMPRKEREILWQRHADDVSRKQKATVEKEDKHTDLKTRNSTDSGRYLSGSKRAHDQR